MIVKAVCFYLLLGLIYLILTYNLSRDAREVMNFIYDTSGWFVFCGTCILIVLVWPMMMFGGLVEEKDE